MIKYIQLAREIDWLKGSLLFKFILLIMINMLAELMLIGFLSLVVSGEELIELFSVELLPKSLYVPVLFIVLILGNCFRILIRYFIVKKSFLFQKLLSIRMYRSVLSGSLNSQLSSSIQSITEETELVAINVYNKILNLLYSGTVSLAVVFGVVYVAGGEVLIIMVSMFFLTGMLMIHIARNLKSIGNSRKTSREAILRHVSDRVVFSDLVFLWKAKDGFYEKFRDELNAYTSSLIKSRFISQLPKPLTEIVMTITLMVYYVGSSLGILPSIDSFQYGMIVASAYRVSPLINIMYSSYTGLRFYKESFDDIFNTSMNAGKDNVQCTPVLNDCVHSLSYSSLKLMLNEIRPGQVVLIHGKSGGGKTTAIKNMMGLNTSVISDELLLIDGVKVPMANRPQYFSYMPQDSQIFQGSIQENINFFRSDLSSPGKKLGLAWLENTDNQLLSRYLSTDAIISKLSGGELQRLNLARCITSSRPILILDEPTSAQDEQSVNHFIQMLKNEHFYQKIIIIISHDERLGEIADNVIEI